MSRAAPFVALMDSVVGGAGKYAAGISAGWMQGRTTFGGCSAALCLEGARLFVIYSHFSLLCYRSFAPLAHE